MRWHVLLMILIVALVVAIALLRPVRPAPDPIRPVAPLVESTPGTETPLTVEDPPAIAPTEPAIAKEATAPKSKKVRVVLEPALKGSVVFLMRSRDFQETYTPNELHSQKDGSVEFDVLAEREWILIYAYEPGVGHGYAHYHPGQLGDAPVRIKLRPAALLRIACTGRDGAPARNVEVTVIGEIEISSSYDLQGNYLGSKRAQLPPRKTLTNEEGRCAFEFLNRGWIRDNETARVQGWRFTITAAGPSGTHEKKFDGLPAKEVAFVLD